MCVYIHAHTHAHNSPTKYLYHNKNKTAEAQRSSPLLWETDIKKEQRGGSGVPLSNIGVTSHMWLLKLKIIKMKLKNLNSLVTHISRTQQAIVASGYHYGHRRLLSSQSGSGECSSGVLWFIMGTPGSESSLMLSSWEL